MRTGRTQFEGGRSPGVTGSGGIGWIAGTGGIAGNGGAYPPERESTADAMQYDSDGGRTAAGRSTSSSAECCVDQRSEFTADCVSDRTSRERVTAQASGSALQLPSRRDRAPETEETGTEEGGIGISQRWRDHVSGRMGGRSLSSSAETRELLKTRERCG